MPVNLKTVDCYLFPGQTVQNTRKWGRITWPGEPRNSHLMQKFAIKSPGQCIHSHFCVSWRQLNAYMPANQNTRKWGRITWPGASRNSHLMQKFAIKSPGQCIHSHFCVSWLQLNACMPANLKSLNCYLFPGQTVQNTRKSGRITWLGEPRNSHLMQKFAIKSPGQCIHSHFCVSWLRLNAYMPANLKSLNCYLFPGVINSA